MYRGDLTITEETQTLNLSYRAPNFWGEQRSGGIRFGYENCAYDNDVFDYRVATISPYYNFKLGEGVGSELRYALSWDKIDNVDAAASNILQTEVGSRVSSGVCLSLITGSKLLGRNGIGGPTWSLRFDQDFTGLGGASLRGFERGTISPRDACVGCAPGGGDQITNLGGNSFAVLRTDLLIPILPQFPSLETFIIGDIGSSWDVQTNAAPTGTLISDRRFHTVKSIPRTCRSSTGSNDFDA